LQYQIEQLNQEILQYSHMQYTDYIEVKSLLKPVFKVEMKLPRVHFKNVALDIAAMENISVNAFEIKEKAIITLKPITTKLDWFHKHRRSVHMHKNWIKFRLQYDGKEYYSEQITEREKRKEEYMLELKKIKDCYEEILEYSLQLKKSQDLKYQDDLKQNAVDKEIVKPDNQIYYYIKKEKKKEKATNVLFENNRANEFIQYLTQSKRAASLLRQSSFSYE
jgi:hypothetical protein